MRLALTLLLASGAFSCARRDEQGSATATPVALLGRETLPLFRDAFNAAADHPRILVMLSPT